MANPVVHFEIAVKDDVKGREFYSKLFGWEIKVDDKFNYGEITTGGEGGIGGGIFKTEPDKFPPYVTVYVDVDDLQKYLDRAGELGGRTILPPMPIPGVGSFAMFADPDGNVIGLYKSG